MRQLRTVLFLLILVPICSSGQAESEIHFKVEYKPGTKYRQVYESAVHNEVTYSGSDELLNYLKEKGIPNPSVSESSSRIESICSTGRMEKDSTFPLVLELVKSFNSSGKSGIPNGTLMYGHAVVGRLPVLDSVVSNDLSEDFKHSLVQAMQNVFSQCSFEERRLKIGDSFSKQIPLSMPFGKEKIDMLIDLTFKLRAIKDGIGDFEISSKYSAQFTVSDFNIHGTGTGNGKLLYNIADKNCSTYQLNTEIKAVIKNADMEATLVSKAEVLSQSDLVPGTLGQ